MSEEGGKVHSLTQPLNKPPLLHLVLLWLKASASPSSLSGRGRAPMITMRSGSSPVSPPGELAVLCILSSHTVCNSFTVYQQISHCSNPLLQL